MKSMRSIKRIMIFLFLDGILFSQGTFCQNTDHVILKFAPLSLIDPYGPHVHFGLEFISKGKIAFESDFSIYIPNIYFNDETPRISNRKGFKLKPEIRFFLNGETVKEKNNRGLYLANEVFFVKDNYKRGDTFRGYDQELDTTYIYFDYEIIDRYEIGDNLKIGYQVIIKEKLIIDSFLGLGLRYYNAKYDYEITDEICCPTMRFFKLPVGKGVVPSYTLGIKVGYKF